ncbi:hypothetical protein JCM3774_002873 [Rhodotorula dairenensis]
MGALVKQECCVCGEPSTMRCGACAKAGVNLYFCSTEHQKLVWFAHKPVCGPGKADFTVLPNLTPVEIQLLQSPALQHLLLRRDNSSARMFVDAVGALETLYHLPAGVVLQNLPRINEWLDSFPRGSEHRVALRVLINTILRACARGNDRAGSLALPSHTFALCLCAWYTSTQQVTYSRRFIHFLHGVTVWGGLLRILDGRIAGADSSRVTPELARANLERILQAVQDDLDLNMDPTGGGFLELISDALTSVPALADIGVFLTTVGGDRATNRIRVAPLREASLAEYFAQVLPE